MIDFILRDHLRLAVHAALLFAVGLFASWPIVHYRLKAPARLPLAVFRLVLKLLGQSPSLARIACVIFCFNTVAMFVYMASGFHPLLPKVFGIWTGLNIGIIMGIAREERELLEAGLPSAGQWRPSGSLAALCGLLVLVLELPCFWFSIGMGIKMGHDVQSGALPYPEALARRALAYAVVIVPLLLLSAMAEAIAIRGSAAGAERLDSGS
ncbi:MAG: stage II sporulation protein M [Planctomycetota bacterium]